MSSKSRQAASVQCMYVGLKGRIRMDGEVTSHRLPGSPAREGDTGWESLNTGRRTRTTWGQNNGSGSSFIGRQSCHLPHTSPAPPPVTQHHPTSPPPDHCLPTRKNIQVRAHAKCNKIKMNVFSRREKVWRERWKRCYARVR